MFASFMLPPSLFLTKLVGPRSDSIPRGSGHNKVLIIHYLVTTKIRDKRSDVGYDIETSPKTSKLGSARDGRKTNAHYRKGYDLNWLFGQIWVGMA